MAIFKVLCYFIANKIEMGLDKKLSQVIDYALPTNNTHIIMTRTQAYIHRSLTKIQSLT
jgi:hypothetical protein